MQIHMKICAVSGMLAALFILHRAIPVIFIMRYARKMKFLLQCDSRHVPGIMKKDPFL
jgi:hypothetical protein